ncbi:MAG: EamA family transporter [Alphaproteobacteria bacterium]|nr:EamA family transporter [Alphaproteobacteria bacterium]
MNPNLAGFLALIIFSVGTLLIALSRSVPTFELLFITFLLGSLSVTLAQKLRGYDVRESWRQSTANFFFVTFGIGLYSFLLVPAFQRAPAFEANILNYLWPLLLVIFSSFVKKTLPKPLQIGGLLCGALGMVFVFMPEADQNIFNTFNLGHILAIGAAVVWALYSAMAQTKTYPVGLTAPVMAFCAFLALCLHLAFEHFVWPGFEVAIAVILLGLGRVSFALWDYGVKNGDHVLLSSLSYFVPLLSVLLFIIFGFKPATANVAIGGAFVVLGCVLANAHQIKKVLRR